MEKKVLVSAHLMMCSKCKMHGFIVYSDGSKSGSIASQEGAFTELKEAKLAGRVLQMEIDAMRDTILDWLPPHDVAEAILEAAKVVIAECANEAPGARSTSVSRLREPTPN